MDELKPCPFCGSAGWVSENQFPGFYAACTGHDCWASVGENYDRDAMPDHHYYDRDAAINAWNRRAGESQ
jgi:hypothetical protein